MRNDTLKNWPWQRSNEDYHPPVPTVEVKKKSNDTSSPHTTSWRAEGHRLHATNHAYIPCTDVGTRWKYVYFRGAQILYGGDYNFQHKYCIFTLYIQNSV